jgi:hypothetical protein
MPKLPTPSALEVIKALNSRGFRSYLTKAAISSEEDSR